MPPRQLYHTPGSCSRVALVALEEVGEAYVEKTVALMAGEQRSPEFRSINWKGKVPVMIDRGVVATELPVILYRLASANPSAKLLPFEQDGTVLLESLSDLVWLAGALHPVVSRLLNPIGVSETDPEGVKTIAMKQLVESAASIEERLSGCHWWHGDQWYVTDMFLNWIFSTAEQFGFAYANFPALRAHRVRTESRPSFSRARCVEIAAVKRDLLTLPPGFAL